MIFLVNAEKDSFEYTVHYSANNTSGQSNLFTVPAFTIMEVSGLENASDIIVSNGTNSGGGNQVPISKGEGAMWWHTNQMVSLNLKKERI